MRGATASAISGVAAKVGSFGIPDHQKLGWLPARRRPAQGKFDVSRCPTQLFTKEPIQPTGESPISHIGRMGSHKVAEWARLSCKTQRKHKILTILKILGHALKWGPDHWPTGLACSQLKIGSPFSQHYWPNGLGCWPNGLACSQLKVVSVFSQFHWPNVLAIGQMCSL